MPPQRLVGRYEYVEDVGQGGFGDVRKYLDLITREHVAVKTIPAIFVDQETKRIIREIDTMMLTHDAHPHVIDFLTMFVTPCTTAGDCFIQGGTHNSASTMASPTPQGLDVTGAGYRNLDTYAILRKHHGALEAEAAKMSGSDKFDLHIVMPLMKGNLLEFINNASPEGLNLPVSHQFIEQVCVVFAFQICFGLDYLHKCNIVHRDMKPENILIDLNRTNPYECNALIADLGLARDAQSSDTFYVCTRYYRPPEMIMAISRGDTSLDVWSFGCILFEMVAGRPLFNNNSAVNERGQWEGARASQQLEVVLNIVGVPTKEDIQRYIPNGNAKMYLLRSSPRPSRLREIMESNWRIHTTRDRQEKWMDLICRCLAFIPEKRLTCEDLCQHQLFRDLGIIYGENVRQEPPRKYHPVQMGTLLVENKNILLSLVCRALQLSAPFLDGDFAEEEERRDETIPFENNNGASSMGEHSISCYGNTSLEPNIKTGGERLRCDFPSLNDPELRREYGTVEIDAVGDVVSRLLDDLQRYTHDPERSSELRSLLNYYTSLGR